MAKEKPTVEKFFTDPATAEEASFFRDSVKYIVAEEVKKAKEANPREADFLTTLFPWLK